MENFYKVIDSEYIITTTFHESRDEADLQARRLARVHDRHFKIHNSAGTVVNAAYPTTDKGMF